MILRRANQKFDMIMEIGHGESMKLSLSAEGDLRQVTWKDAPPVRKDALPSTTAPVQSSREQQRTPWVPRKFTSSSITSRAQCCPTVCHLFISTPKFGTGSCSQSHLSWSELFHRRYTSHPCQSILDTRRGVKALRRRPFTIVSEKAPTSSHPGAVRDYSS